MDKETLRKMGETLLSNPLLASFEPNPDRHPPIIYKFRNWREDFHKDLLIKNELYLSSPNDLNDPFDCKIFENHLKFIDTPELKEKYINESLERNQDYLQKNNLSYEQGKKIIASRIQDILYYQVRSEEISNEHDEKHVGITCFSENWDSTLMWSHYGDNHKGYCLGFDEKWLRYSQLFGKIKRIEYSDDYPQLNPFERNEFTKYTRYFYKSKGWEYEKEIRIMNLFLDYQTEKPNRVIILEDKYIKEIILGVKISSEDRESIIKHAKEKNIDIWQAVKNPSDFGITRYKL